jgi:ribonuclease BN (tRNA processing enzyme)
MTTTVTILGSGTCVPSVTRSSAAVLVSAGHERILLDAGPGTLRQLAAAGQSIFTVSHLLLTHFHPDHCSDLPGFLFANKYPDGNRRQATLRLIGARGLRRFFQALTDAWGRWIQLPEDLFTLIELTTDGPDHCAGESFSLASCPVAHNPESLAYRITGADGLSVVCSGDTDECEDLVDLARGADLLVCESATPDGLKVPGHLTPSLAGRIAAEAKVGHLVLTHFYPSCDTVDIAAECRRTWSGPLTVARDLMRIRPAPGGPAEIIEVATP